MACKFVNWHKDVPLGILQVSYHSPNSKWVCRLTYLDKNGFIKQTIKQDNIDKELKEAVIKKFKWAKEEKC